MIGVKKTSRRHRLLGTVNYSRYLARRDINICRALQTSRLAALSARLGTESSSPAHLHHDDGRLRLISRYQSVVISSRSSNDRFSSRRATVHRCALPSVSCAHVVDGIVLVTLRAQEKVPGSAGLNGLAVSEFEFSAQKGLIDRVDTITTTSLLDVRRVAK